MTNLYIFRESSEHLLGHLECLEEIFPPGQVNGTVARVVPIEVRDGLLYTKQVVHCTHNDIDSGGVARLRPQVVLEGEVVPLAQKLEKSEERDGECMVWEDFTNDWSQEEGKRGKVTEKEARLIFRELVL